VQADLMTLRGYHGAISDVIGGELREVKAAVRVSNWGFSCTSIEKRHGEDRSDLANLM
jgi:hypothetical protein